MMYWTKVYFLHNNFCGLCSFARASFLEVAVSSAIWVLDREASRPDRELNQQISQQMLRNLCFFSFFLLVEIQEGYIYLFIMHLPPELKGNKRYK